VNFGWTLAGNVVYAGCQWVLLVIIARLASPEAVGMFGLGLAVTAPVFLFAGLHLRASQATDAARRFSFADYHGVSLAGMLAAFAATTALAVLSSFEPETRAVLLAVAAAKAIEGVCDVHYGLLQQHERMRPIAISVILRGTLSVVGVAAVLALGGGLLLALVVLAGSWLAVLVVHDWRVATDVLHAMSERHLPRFRWRTAGRIAAISLPLGIVTMLVSLRTTIPRYFIEHHAGTGELGIFVALSSLVASGQMLLSALAQSVHPRLARYYFEGRLTAFRRLLAKALGVAIAVGGVGLVLAATVGRPGVLLVFGEQYARRTDVLVWLVAAGILAYAGSFVGYAVTATRRFGVQLPLFAFTSASCAGASAWLIPRHGLVGGAWAWGGTLLLELVGTATILTCALRKRARSPVTS
jgi:O-antigen/teichoic acid export membrane protein